MTDAENLDGHLSHSKNLELGANFFSFLQIFRFIAKTCIDVGCNRCLLTKKQFGQVVIATKMIFYHRAKIIIAKVNGYGVFCNLAANRVELIKVFL